MAPPKMKVSVLMRAVQNLIKDAEKPPKYFGGIFSSPGSIAASAIFVFACPGQRNWGPQLCTDSRNSNGSLFAGVRARKTVSERPPLLLGFKNPYLYCFKTIVFTSCITASP